MLYDFCIPYFHASELERFWDVEIYKNIIDSRKRLIQLQERAFQLIHDYSPRGIAAAVFKEDFVDAMHPVHGADECYSFCAQECMRGVFLTLEREGPAEWAAATINCVFEYGAHGWGWFDSAVSGREVRNRWKIGGVSREDKRILPPLQAADALAYETFKEIENGLVYKRKGLSRKRPRRKSAERLIRPRPKDFTTYWDRARLIRMFVEPWEKKQPG